MYETVWDIGEQAEQVIHDDRSSAPESSLIDSVLGLTGARERVDVAHLVTLADWDRRQCWLADGSINGWSWLAHHTVMAPKDARRQMRVVGIFNRYEFIAKALVHGDITVAHVDAIASRWKPERAALLARDEHTLVNLATDPDLTVDGFDKVMKRWAMNADDELGVDPDARKRMRSVHLSKTLHGYRLDGDLTDQDGAIIETALESIASRPNPTDHPGGPRTLAQRRNDALVAICSHFLSCHNDSGAPIHTVDVIIDIQKFRDFAHHYAEATDQNDPVADEPAEDVVDNEREPFDAERGDQPPMTVEDLTGRCDILRPNGQSIPLLPRDVEALLSRSYLGRVLMDGPSVVLDAGRRRRLFSKTQDRLVIIRDGPGCPVPGCPNPGDEMHHLKPWDPIGKTNLDNAARPCSTHHRDITQGRATLTRNRYGTYTFTVHRRRPRKT